MADGRVEIKFLTDTKEIETAKKTVSDLGTTIDKALEVKTTSNATSVVEKVGTSADDSASKMTGLSKATEQATDSVDNLGDEADRLGNESVGDLPDGIEDIGDKAQKSTGGVGSLVKALGLLKVAGVAINMIRNSLGDAVTRVDTMRNFPRMMQQVGFTTDETEQSIERLSSGIDGLPTALDEVVSTAQQLALTTGDLGQATELTLALNNAFLASGSSSADASRGLQQFSQMLSSGKVDMQSWKTLLETMPLALQTVAANFGYTGASAKNDLYAALQDGTITFDDFSQALIDANEAQGGFAELAKTNSEGMATSWTNIQTAVTRGVANVITALDEMIEDLTGNNIAQHFDNLKVGIGDTFNTITSSIRSATPYVQTGISMFQRMTPVTTSLAAAYATLKIVQTVGGFFEASNKAILAAEVAKKGVTLATKTMTAAEIASTGALSASQLVYGLLTGKIAAATVAKQAFAAASSFMLSPLGLVVGAVALATGAFMLMKDSILGISDEVSTLSEKTDEYVTASDAAIQESDKSREAFEKQKMAIDDNETALLNLIGKLDEVTKKEGANKAERELAIGIVDKLNGSIDGLGLTYDSETNSINLSTDALRENIRKRAEMERATGKIDRLIDLEMETAELESQLKKTEELLEEIRNKRKEIGNSTIADGASFGDYRELTEELDRVKGTYTEVTNSIEANKTEMTGLEQEIEAYTQSVVESAEATEASAKQQQVDVKKIADSWKNLDFEEKQATLKTMGKDDIQELMTILGVDFESLPDEFHKDAYLNAYGYDGLEELLFLTGEWATLTLEEKKAVLKPQIDHEGLEEVIEVRDLWNEEEFVSQLAEIKMNDSNAEEQVLNLINQWGELDDLEPVEMEVNIRQIEEAIQATENQQVALSDLTENQQDAVQSIRDYYTEVRDLASDPINKIEIEIDTNLDAEGVQFDVDALYNQMMETMAHNRQAIQSYSDNLSTIAAAGASDQLMAYLEDLGVDAAPYIEALASQTTEEIQAFSDEWDLGAETSLEITADASGLELTGLEDLITGVENDLIAQIEASQLGATIAEVLGNEINQSEAIDISPNLQLIEGFDIGDIGGTVNTEIETSINEAGPINISPNLEPVEDFNLQGEEIGKTVGDAIATGVGSANENISSAGRTGGEGAVTGFAAGGSGSYIAGQMLGTGLNNGLASMHNTVVSTAVAMANAAVQAINDALGVASPAKEGIYSGRMLGLGVGGGMEDEMSYIEATADEMALKAIPNFDRIDVNRALSLPHFETMQTSQNITSTQSLAGLDGLARQMDQLIKKNSNVYIQGEKAGELLSDVTDRTSGRESIYNERWT